MAADDAAGLTGPARGDGGALEHEHVGHAKLYEGARGLTAQPRRRRSPLRPPRGRSHRSGGPARNPTGSGQRDPGHGGGLDGEGGEILGLEVVHVGLAARPGQSGDLHGHGRR